MHELYLMRHAKAEDAYRGSDHARRLTERGVRNAAEIGAVLRPRGIQLAKVSSSARTQQTAQALRLDCPIEVIEDLYSCGTDTMRALIADTPETVESLIVVAHSPATPALVWQLAHEPAGVDLAWFPTATVASFSLTGTWRNLLDESLDTQVRFLAIRRASD